MKMQTILADKRSGDVNWGERFREAFYISPEATSISTLADGYFLDVNHSFLEMTGYAREEVIGRCVADLHFWYSPEERRKLLRMLEASEGPLRRARFRLRTKFGVVRHIDVSVDTLDLDGKDCLLVIYRDITDQKESIERVVSGMQTMRKVGKALDSTRLCVRELEYVQHAAEEEIDFDAVNVLSETIRGTMEAMIDSLHNLHELQGSLSTDTLPTSPCQRINCPRRDELEDVIREGISTLERTKGSFKSKELGNLRQKLDRVLESRVTQ